MWKIVSFELINILLENRTTASVKGRRFSPAGIMGSWKEKVELPGLLSINLWKGDSKQNLEFHHSVSCHMKNWCYEIRSESHLSETRRPRLLAWRLTLRDQLVKILIMQWEKWRKRCLCVWVTTIPISLSLPLLAISPLVSAAKPSIGFSETPSYYSSLELQPQAMFTKK